jgi:hypothetical protein
LERKGIQDRVELVAADFLRDDCGLPGRVFDCVFLSHVLHDFDGPIASAIGAHAVRRFAAGGKLVILDVLAADGGYSNPVEALFDLMMLVEVPGGRTRRISDVYEWIETSRMAPPKAHKLHFGILLEALAKP